jgi:hypothetical protein
MAGRTPRTPKPQAEDEDDDEDEDDSTPNVNPLTILLYE